MGRMRPYIASTGIIVLATLARLALTPFLGLNFPLLTYWPAVEVIAYFFGFRPALASIGLSLVCGRLLFMAPLHPLLFPLPGDVIGASLFVLFSASLAMFMESLRSARHEAEENAGLAQERLEQLEREMVARKRERDWAESVLASIGDGVIAADSAGNVTYLNEVAEQLTGWRKSEAEKQPLNRVFYTIEQPPVPLLAATNGRMIPVEHNVAAIRDGQNNELGKVLVFRDVTERRRAQELLEQSERRMHASLGAAGAAAWELDLKTGEVICSREFRELTGTSGREEYLHFAEWMDSVHEQDRYALEAELKSSERRGGEFRLEYRTIRDGEIRWLGLMGSLAFAGRTYGIVVDVTERRRMEEKIRSADKQESLGVLSGGIAHDFNNLLTSILGYASLLRNELPPSSQLAEYARSIESASERAAYLIRQILAYSGQGRFSLEHLDMSEQVRKTLAEMRATIPAHVIVALDLTTDLPAVAADPRQAEQVVGNILRNALEAIGHSQGSIEVSTYLTTVSEGDIEADEMPCGVYVVFQVRDNGPGMDQETQQKIFDPFFTTKFMGRGLGLAAVLGIVRGHAGMIRVESELGRGTLFQVYWPVENAKAARAT